MHRLTLENTIAIGGHSDQLFLVPVANERKEEGIPEEEAPNEGLDNEAASAESPSPKTMVHRGELLNGDPFTFIGVFEHRYVGKRSMIGHRGGTSRNFLFGLAEAAFGVFGAGHVGDG